MVSAFAVLLFLAASARAQFFRITKNGGPSTVYRVRGVVTLTTPELSGHRGAALEYSGDLAVRRLTHDNYAAQFLDFQMKKYNRTLSTVDDPDVEAMDGLPPVVEHYSEYFKDPVNFVYKHGKVLTYLVPYDAKMWTVNIYRAVLTLFQSPAVKPKEVVDAPRVFSVYEDGVTGYCRVQYELKVKTNNELNFTKTHYLDDCQVERPAYLLDEADVHGCPGVCSKHTPTNFVPGYEPELTDYLSKPKPGCPVSMRPVDTQVSVHGFGQYVVNKRLLQNVSAETIDVLHQYGGKVTSRTKFQLGLLHHNGPEIDKAKHVTFYDTLAFTLPEVYNDLDVPIYSLYLGNITDLKPEVFNLYFKTAVEELIHLAQVDDSADPKKTPSLVLQMIEALSAMKKEQIQKTIPPPLKKKVSDCNQDEQLERALYLDLLSKAGSNASIDVLLDFVVDKVLTNFESVSILQDVAAFKAYPDAHIVETLLELCLLKKNKTELSPMVVATACATVGTVISKACPSVVEFPPYVPLPPTDVDGPFPRPNDTDPEFPQHEADPALAPPFEYKERENCTVKHLVQYVKDLTTALETSKDFKHAVALVTALAKAAKPEVIPSLLPYVNGTAPNLPYLVDEGESVEEAVVFFRQITLLVLNDLVAFYPKEVNPIVRTIYWNTSEPHQLRLLAFDIWLKTVPAQWEVQKVVVTAKLDDSVELGSYVFTALRSLLRNKLPCNEILASRVRAVFRHVKHLDLGFRFSHLYKPSTYDPRRELGVEATFKKVASNTSRLAASHLSLLYNVASYYRVPASYTFLPKGGEKLVAEVVGEGGLLELLSKALSPNYVPEPQPPRTVDVAKELNITDRNVEPPKAAFLWKFLNGETVLPVDKQYLQVLKEEIVEWVRQLVGGDGKKHFVRVLLPAKQYHVEPTTLGVPLVHSTLHPVVVSLRVDDLYVRYENRPNSVLPKRVYVSGTFHPAVLSLRQTLVFAADVQKLLSPSVVISDVKEVALKSKVIVSYYHPTKRLFAEVKPEFNRLLLTTHCVEHTLKKNLLLSEDPSEPWMDYGECVKSLPVPYLLNSELLGKELGMVVKVNGTSHKSWAGLSPFGSLWAKKEGSVQALLQALGNVGWKHYLYTVGLKSYIEDPVDRWRLHYHITDNIDELVPGPGPEPPCPWCTTPVPPPFNPVSRMWSMISMRDSAKETEVPNAFIEEDDETSAAAYYTELSDLPGMQDRLQVLLNETQKPVYKTAYKHNISTVLVGCLGPTLKRIVKVALTELHTLDRTARKFAVLVKSDVYSHDLEAYGNVTYPEMDSFFNLDPAFIGTDFVNASLVTRLFNATVGHNETYVLYYNATKSEEQLVGFSAYHYKPLLKWYTPQCLADLKAGKTVSYACNEAVVHDAHLDQQVLTVSLPEKVDSRVKQASLTAVDLLKYYLFPRVVFHPADPVLSSKNQLVFYFNKTMANPFVTLLNSKAYLPYEKLVVKNLPVPKYFSPNTALETEERVSRTITDDNPLMPCGVGKHAVRTFDNFTYPLEVRRACSYLLARDCTGTSNLTVVLVPLNVTAGLKKLVVQLSNTVVELLPPSLHVPEVHLVVNTTEYVAVKDKDVVLPFDAKDKFMVQVHRVPNPRGTPVVLLKTTNNLLKLHFDGFNVYLWLNKKFQRSACGLCGNYDNEASHELVTPDNVEAANYTLFTTSYAFDGMLGSNCKTPVPPLISDEVELELYRSMLIDGKDPTSDIAKPSVTSPMLAGIGLDIDTQLLSRTTSEDLTSEEVEEVPEEENDCVVKRTVIRHREDLVCFSKVLVPTCKTHCIKTRGAKTVDVSFTCLPKSDTRVPLWTRKVREEGALPVSYHDDSYSKTVQKIRVPEECVPSQ